jgi:hypothetical protein
MVFAQMPQQIKRYGDYTVPARLQKKVMARELATAIPLANPVSAT